VPRTKWSYVSGILISAALFAVAWPTAALRGQAPAGSPQGAQAQAPIQATRAPLAPTDVVLTVGSVSLTMEEFEKIAASLPAQFSGALTQLGKRGFADQYANLLALAQAGEKLRIDQRETFQKMMEFQRILMLAQTTLNELAATPGTVTPDDIQAFYASHQSDFEEVHLRGIYVPYDPPPGTADAPVPPPAGEAANPAREKLTEAAANAKAQSLRTRIQNGADFAELARTESEHPTASRGGDFGFVKRNQFAPQIDNAVFALQPNQVTEPLRDRFGFFIFQLEGKRIQPLPEVQQTIENNLRQQTMMDLFARMKLAYPITMDPRYFADSPAPPQR